nr:hypothetical protein Iba_chr01cCG3930 [Ipomoea batatas]
MVRSARSPSALSRPWLSYLFDLPWLYTNSARAPGRGPSPWWSRSRSRPRPGWIKVRFKALGEPLLGYVGNSVAWSQARGLSSIWRSDFPPWTLKFGFCLCHLFLPKLFPRVANEVGPRAPLRVLALRPESLDTGPLGSSVGVCTQGQASCPLRVLALRPESLDTRPLGSSVGVSMRGRASCPLRVIAL